MSQYLEKFKGTIGTKQSNQILKLLNKKREEGRIRTMEEFSTQLNDLIAELQSTKLQPSLTLYQGDENAPIDSQQFNFMLDRVEDDLTAAFEEANNIDTVQQSHEALIRDMQLKNLRAGIAELESKITRFCT